MRAAIWIIGILGILWTVYWFVQLMIDVMERVIINP